MENEQTNGDLVGDIYEWTHDHAWVFPACHSLVFREGKSSKMIAFDLIDLR